MEQVIVAMDTSCYTTSAAVVSLDGKIITSQRLLLPVQKGQGGLRQSDGVFLHVKQLPIILEKMAPILADYKLEALCVSTRPTGQVGSYMPVFLVGKMAAQTMALGAGVPCFYTNHQAGHIAAALVDTGIQEQEPFLALHLSGGTTDVLLCNNNEITPLGGSKDLHAGQLVDRVGVALGCSFPAGKELEALALKGESQNLISASMSEKGLYCHLSGAEAQAFRWIKESSLSKENIAAEIYSFLVRTVGKMMIAHGEMQQINQVLLAGGVASSCLFKKELTAYMKKRAGRIELYFAKPQLAGDNAVGVAMIGRKKLLQLQKDEKGGRQNGGNSD